MPQTIYVNLKLEADIKRKMEQICDELGLPLNVAFNLFAKKVVAEKRIPFDLAIVSANLDAINNKTDLLREDMDYKHVESEYCGDTNDVLTESTEMVESKEYQGDEEHVLDASYYLLRRSFEEHPRDVRTYLNQYFYVSVNDGSIFVSRANSMYPSVDTISPIKLEAKECEKMYTLYLDEDYSNAQEMSSDYVYWFGIFDDLQI